VLLNYLKLTFRNIKRYKIYSFINLSGLAVGLATAIVIGIYVFTELSYDKFHKNLHRIYRVGTDFEFGGGGVRLASTNFPLGPVLKTEFPEVENSVRLRRLADKTPVQYLEKHFLEEDVFYSDPSIFKIFSFNVIEGNAESALEVPYSIVLTKTIAEKYFKKEAPIGKLLKVAGDEKLYTVTAVVDDVPKNSHIKFTILVSFESMRQQVGTQMERWMGDFQNYTYIILHKDADYKKLEAKFPELIQKNIGELLAATKGKFELFLQPLNSIYLYSETLNEFPQKGDIRYIYIFSGIALLILIIACINFLNLSTARSAARSKEVGVKKVLGAKRSQILFQFLTESILFTSIALCLAIAVISTLWPLINQYTGLNDSVLWNNKLIFSVALSALILLIGIAAGLYPAFFFSSFKPEFVLKFLKIGRRSSHFRNGLVVVQFIISTVLIVSTLIIMNQLNYIQNKKLGFKKDNIVVVPFDYKASLRSIESLKSDLLANPDILNVTTSSAVPGQFSRQNLFVPEGFTVENAPIINAINADKDYLPSMKLELISGRNFSDEFPGDKKNSIIINESAAKRFGWENPIGKRITELAREHPTKIVIGVVKDFHFLPLYFKIDPLIIENEEAGPDPSIHHYNRPVNYFLVSIAPVNFKKSVDYIKSILENKNSPLPYESFFLDDDFNQIYKSEVQLSQIFSYFTGIAIFLACLGLFGLAAYTSEQRTKEIGIRKVLGATVTSMIFMLTNEFVKWVLLANLAAWPAAYYFMNKWLQDFAYRIEISWWMFALSGGIALVIALATVSFQAIKAATANPVESLKYE